MAYKILFNTLENTLAREAFDAFKKEGHLLFVGAAEDEMDSLDLLVLTLPHSGQDDGRRIGEGLDLSATLDTASENAAAILTAAKEAIPYLRSGKLKRIAFLTDKTASIRESLVETNYGYHMAQAAANLAMKILFNTYRPHGFTFRCFAASSEDLAKGGISATEYILTEQSYIETDDYIHSDENRLVMRDGFLREITW